LEKGSAPEVYHPAPDDPVIVLDLDQPARWIAEQYPNDEVVARPDGVLRVTLRSGQRAWLERLLLRAGPFARVVEGDKTIGPAAARRLLGRYRH
jgi:proteasome accessory factor C